MVALSGFGNAIVPAVAAEFIAAYVDAVAKAGEATAQGAGSLSDERKAKD
jgi:hypothetical protein